MQTTLMLACVAGGNKYASYSADIPHIMSSLSAG